MNPFVFHRLSSPRCSRRGRILALAFALAVGIPSLLPAQTLEEAGRSTSAALKQAVRERRADYRKQQFTRLAHNNDRESLIAATLLGMPTDNDHQPVQGHAEVMQRLRVAHGQDATVLFALALACQMQSGTCEQADAYDALLKLEPSNAVHWLMLPNGATPSDAQLHAAAAASYADSHLREMVRSVRTALADQNVEGEAGIDANELALALRRDAVDQVALPKFGGVMVLCKGAVDQRKADCLELGRRLTDDRSGTFLARMVGSTMLRRLLKGTPEEATAKEMRREYAWLSEKLTAATVPFAEGLQEDVTEYGERVACQRAVERLGQSRTPAAGWLPNDPQALLLPEERTPVSAK